MIVSDAKVRDFLLSLVLESNFPGKAAPFVMQVLNEVQNATIQDNSSLSKSFEPSAPATNAAVNPT